MNCFGSSHLALEPKAVSFATIRLLLRLDTRIAVTTERGTMSAPPAESRE